MNLSIPSARHGGDHPALDGDAPSAQRRRERDPGMPGAGRTEHTTAIRGGSVGSIAAEGFRRYLAYRMDRAPSSSKLNGHKTPLIALTDCPVHADVQRAEEKRVSGVTSLEVMELNPGAAAATASRHF